MIYERKHLDLLRELVSLQFRLKDQATALGMLWSLLHPLLMLTVLLVVFSHRMGASMDNFALYLLVGVVHFTYFANATSAAMHSLYNMRQLTRDTVFPKELLVIGVVLSRTTEFLISLGVCIPFALFSGVSFSWTLLLLPVVILLHVLLVIWVSLCLSFVYLFVRDIDHLYQVILRVLFFMTPIFYELSYLGDGIARQLVTLNPLTQLISMARAVILYGEVPAPTTLLLYLLVNGLLAVGSIRLFRRVEPALAEVL